VKNGQDADVIPEGQVHYSQAESIGRRFAKANRGIEKKERGGDAIKHFSSIKWGNQNRRKRGGNETKPLGKCLMSSRKGHSEGCRENEMAGFSY